MTRADESETRRAEGPRVDARDVAGRGDDATRRAELREAGDGVRALKIRKNSGRDYWVSVRQWSVDNEIMLRWGLKSGNWMSGDGLSDVMGELVAFALQLSELKKFCGVETPTVIT